jgi:hypothetical protein
MITLISLCIKTLSWLNCVGLVNLLDPNFRILIIYYFLKFFAELNDFRESMDRIIRTKESNTNLAIRLSSSNISHDKSNIEIMEKKLLKLKLILNSKKLNSIIQNLLHTQKVFMSDEQGALDFMDIFCIFVFLYLRINIPIYNQTSQEIIYYKTYFKSNQTPNLTKNRESKDRKRAILKFTKNNRFQLCTKHERFIHQNRRIRPKNSRGQITMLHRHLFTQSTRLLQSSGLIRKCI